MSKFFRWEPYWLPSSRNRKRKESSPDELYGGSIDVSPET